MIGLPGICVHELLKVDVAPFSEKSLVCWYQGLLLEVPERAQPSLLSLPSPFVPVDNEGCFL